MSLRASLPMYPQAGCRPLWQRLWSFIEPSLRHGGVAAPAALRWPHDLAREWRHPQLLLSQTCALPFREGLHKHVATIGTFDFGLDGCPPGYYCSHLVTRRDDTRTVDDLLENGRIAINGWDSQSGCNSLRQIGVTLKDPLVSGGHIASARAIAEGRADIAAIDAMSWRLLTQTPGWRTVLRVRDTTPPTPAMPIITSYGRDLALLRHAMQEAFDAMPRELLARLGLKGFVPATNADYLA